jgi:aminopeptidase
MAEPRIEKLARLLVEYSIGLKKGQKLMIRGHYLAAPLIRECYRAAIKAGAHVESQISIEGLDEIFFKNASQEQLTYVSPIAKLRVKTIDAFIGIWADANTRGLTGADPKKMAVAAKAGKAVNKIFMERAAKKQLRWSGTMFPTNANAQDAEMSLSEYEDFVYGAGHLDDPDPIKTWKTISKSQQALVDALNKTHEIRVVAKDTNLVLGVRGRRWLNCDGHENFPDGEVFTGPVEKTVNGHIRFTFPAVRQGREVINAALEFKDGKCVKATADKGQDFLQAMIDMDAGSCYLGELAFGVNYNITRYTRNTLFDEKIGGTVHVALGAGYPETGNSNESGLHWDMVVDMHGGGKIFADGKLIQQDGRFLDKRFPQPAKK